MKHRGAERKKLGESIDRDRGYCSLRSCLVSPYRGIPISPGAWGQGVSKTPMLLPEPANRDSAAQPSSIEDVATDF